MGTTLPYAEIHLPGKINPFVPGVATMSLNTLILLQDLEVQGLATKPQLAQTAEASFGASRALNGKTRTLDQ